MQKSLPFLLIAGLFAFSASLHAERQVLDKVVAVVNDEAITQSEIDLFLRPLYEQYSKDLREDKLFEAMTDARKKLLSQMIEDRLVFQEAKTQNISIPEEEIDAQLQQLKSKFKTEDELEESLSREGLTLTTLRERIKKQAMIRKLQDTEVRAKVVVSPTEIEEFYKNNPQEFTSHDQIRVRSITLKKSEEAREKGLTDEAAKNKLLGLRKRLQANEDFGKLAKEYSQDTNAKEGGEGEWVERGGMIQAIDDVIFQLKPGEVSEIIETPMGYHLFRVEEKRAGKTLSFEEARDAIYNQLYSKKARARFEEWMEGLKKQAYISVR